MEIREAEGADRAAIEAVVAAAFDEPVDGRVVAMVRALDDSRATRVRLVADDEGVLGYVHLSRGWIDTRAALAEVLTLTPIAVEPDRQRKGIGTALLAAAIQQADDLGFPAVVLEGDWTYYGARGFQPAEDRGLLRPSDRIPRPAFQVALLSSYQPEIVGRLVYPEAMWITDCVGLRDPRLATVEASIPTS
ncbi:MAG: GNAT family N-acetyltransferase [Actinomycetota bacterium]|nr:GNAT family N-acetyltransferase [Actinomycetota bacterium]